MELKVHSLPQTQLLNLREESLAIIWRIKCSFSTSNATTQPLEKEVWPLSGETKVHSLPLNQLLNRRERSVAIIWEMKSLFSTSNTKPLS